MSLTGHTKVRNIVAELMEDAQTVLKQKTVEVGCNAALNMNCNVTMYTVSRGENGTTVTVTVTLVGTPCVVVPQAVVPTISAIKLID